MSVVVSFTGYTPPARYDAVAWTDAQIEEAATETGAYAIIDTVSLGTPDVNPAAPAARNFTTTLGTATDQWYRVVFLDAGLTTSEPTEPVQNSAAASINADPYATATELAGILHIRSPSTEQIAKLERVLSAAAGEINSEIGRVSSDLDGWETDLAAQVNLDRAADLWRHTESIPGVTGILGDDGGMVLPGRYSWERYAQRLAPLKQEWGLA